VGERRRGQVPHPCIRCDFRWCRRNSTQCLIIQVSKGHLLSLALFSSSELFISDESGTSFEFKYYNRVQSSCHRQYWMSSRNIIRFSSSISNQ